MPSHLRNQTTFAPFSAHNTDSAFPHTVAQRPQKKQRMTITQTYRLAHSARGKLSSEASRGDHDLRVLVGHANLLDSLMVELQDAENEQEAWFNETMKSSAPKSPEEPRHVQWMDEVVKTTEEQDDESDDSDDEYETMAPLRKVRSPPAPVSPIEYFGDDEEDDEDSDDESDNLDLALVRTHSRRADDLPEPQPQPQSQPIQIESPPELVHDSSDESDDDSSPPSTPPQQHLTLDIAEIHRQQGIKSADFGAQQKVEELLDDGLFQIRPREGQAPLIAAY